MATNLDELSLLLNQGAQASGNLAGLDERYERANALRDQPIREMRGNATGTGLSAIANLMNNYTGNKRAAAIEPQRAAAREQIAGAKNALPMYQAQQNETRYQDKLLVDQTAIDLAADIRKEDLGIEDQVRAQDQANVLQEEAEARANNREDVTLFHDVTGKPFRVYTEQGKFYDPDTGAPLDNNFLKDYSKTLTSMSKSSSGGGTYGKAPTYAYNPKTNELIALQLSSEGGAQKVVTPEGFEVVGPSFVSNFTDMGGEFTSLFKEERQAAAEGLPANSFAKTLKPEDQIAYLTQREDIKTKAARYLKTQDAKDQLAREKGPMEASLRGGRLAQRTVTVNLADARRMINNGFSTTGFWGNQIGNLPVDTDARTLRNKLDTVKANIAFAALKDMRDSSVSGSSGLGQLNKQEYEALQASWGAVDRATSKAELLTALSDIEDRINGYADSSNTLYRDLYGEDYIYEADIRRGEDGEDIVVFDTSYTPEMHAELEEMEAKIAAAAAAAAAGPKSALPNATGRQQ